MSISSMRTETGLASAYASISRVSGEVICDGANHRNSTSVNDRVNRFFANSNKVDRCSQH